MLLVFLSYCCNIMILLASSGSPASVTSPVVSSASVVANRQRLLMNFVCPGLENYLLIASPIQPLLILVHACLWELC